MTIGAGALLAVDPGQWISITSPSQITVAGTLRAPGGNIAIINDGGMAQTPDLNPDGLSIFISSGATLDVAAQAFTATDIWGRTYGVAPSGGSILLGTNQTAFKNGYIGSVDAFIIVQQNALLDASGARAVVDSNTLLEAASGLLGTRAGVPTIIAGNGGSITMTSYDGIYVDGTMAARAGGPGAAGGTLSVTLETPDYSGHSGPVPAAALLVPRVITISQGALAPQLPAGLEPGANDRSLQFGQARFSADTLNAAGFDNLAFTARDVILFNGNVYLRAGQSIAFHEGAIADTSANATVTISAPYVLLDGHTPVNVPQNSYYPTIWVWSPSKQQSTGTFSVNADLIDIEDDVRFGVNSPAQTTGSSGLTGTPIAYDYAGFANVNLTSQGDIRFTASTPTGTVALIPPQQGTATLITSGSLTFTAEQLYPVSNSIANITAGYVGNNASLNPNSVLTIASVNNVVPAVPYSVNGTITFDAATIDQGGVVRAPLGSVTLGTTNNTVSVNLLPGSITSSSGNGLIIPYGGTPDGTTYNYDGVTFAPDQFGNTVYYKNVVSLQGQSINVQHGATVDVSGGGELAGAGFISGEGGSVNVMATPLVNANPANSFSHAGDQVYAIIPGYQNGYGPVDNSGGTMPGIGQQITITQSVPGLAAGTYTLLPANYAILPGALRIEIGGAINSQGVGAVGASSYMVAGYQGISNTGFRSTASERVIITSGTALRSDSRYNETNFSQFLIQNAAALGQVVPELPADAGTLVFNYSSILNPSAPALIFAGKGLFAPGVGGHGGTSVIEGNGVNFEIDSGKPTPGFNGVSINVADLNEIGAPRLGIGAYPDTIDPGSGNVTIAANANSVTLDSNVVLSAPEVLLAATGPGGIVLDPGAVIDTIGSGAAALGSGFSGVYVFNSTVLAVSNGTVPLAAGVQPNATSPITIGDGARLMSEGSFAFGTSGGVSISDSAVLGTSILGLSSPAINIGEASQMAGAVVPAGFNLSPEKLARTLERRSIRGSTRDSDPDADGDAIAQFLRHGQSRRRRPDDG